MRKKILVVGLLVAWGMGCVAGCATERHFATNSRQRIAMGDVWMGESRWPWPDSNAPKYELVGCLHQPFGKLCVIQGVMVDGPRKGYESGPNLQVKRINGIATQKTVQICLRPHFLNFGEGKIPAIEMGKTYELEGYTSGDFVGEPDGVYQKTGVLLQTTSFYFREEFVIINGTKLPSTEQPAKETP